ncbi:Uncharacterised protein [uncultured archaeon]|nr:Uncharacterised protein [uncultured archaeon]
MVMFRELRAKHYLNKALRLEKQGRIDEAIGACGKCLSFEMQYDWTSTAAHEKRASFYFRKNDFEKALKDAEPEKQFSMGFENGMIRAKIHLMNGEHDKVFAACMDAYRKMSSADLANQYNELRGIWAKVYENKGIAESDAKKIVDAFTYDLNRGQTEVEKYYAEKKKGYDAIYEKNQRDCDAGRGGWVRSN